MPEFSVKAWYTNDNLKLNDVCGEKYPDGKSYIIPAPSAADELLVRRIVQLEEKLSALIGPMRLGKQDGETDAAATARLEKVLAEIKPMQKEHDDLLLELDRDEDGNPIDHAQKMLGPVYDEMIADGVRPRMVEEFAALVTTNYGSGERAARVVVAMAEGEAAARTPNRAIRRAAAKSTPRKRQPSKLKAGSKSSPASSASDTPATQTPTSSSAPRTSVARKRAARKTA